MDRILQSALLSKMEEVYPQSLYGFPNENDDYSPSVIREITYLTELGLCSSKLGSAVGSELYFEIQPRITAQGLDFLEDDGGLTAILGVVTIKLHAETLRSLLEAKVDRSDLPPEKKSALKHAIGKLSGTALQAGSADLVKMGLEHAPDALQWLMRITGL